MSEAQRIEMMHARDEIAEALYGKEAYIFSAHRAAEVAAETTVGHYWPLLDDLCVDDPICHSTEGIDDGCHWCGARARYCFGSTSGCDNPDSSPYRPGTGKDICGYGGDSATHEPDCPWMRAARLLGRDLGHHREAHAGTERAESDGTGR